MFLVSSMLLTAWALFVGIRLWRGLSATDADDQGATVATAHGRDPGAFNVLGSALVGVCVLQMVAGVWLWQGRRRGAQLALATTPLALGLGAGFALPFVLVGAPINAALVLAGRRGLG